MTEPITSDVPPGLPQETNPEREAWLKRLKSEWCEIEPENLEALGKLATDPDLKGRFLNDINRTVKHDNHVVLTNFYTGLSAYADPIAIGLKAISGAGKSYGTTETMSYFPKGDVKIIGSQSPKVISHDYGEFMTGDDEPLDPDNAPQKPRRSDYDTREEFSEAYTAYREKRKAWSDKLQNSYHLIRLQDQIYVFLETISEGTFNMFKATLSQDEKRITHKYVDEKGKVHVTVLEGRPSVVFCSIDVKYIEEFATRTFTVTPNTTRTKIGAAKKVDNDKASFPHEYEEDTLEKKLIKALIVNIKDALKLYNLKVVVPFPNLYEEFPGDITRDMRDFKHFLQLLKTYPIFYLFQRPIITIGKQKYLVVTIDDVQRAKSLFDEIAETTKTGTDKKILDFYRDYVKKHKNGATIERILEDVNASDDYKKNPMGDSTARFYLKRLGRLSWVQVKKGEVETDKRKDTFYPLKDLEDVPEPQRKLSESSAKKEIELNLKAKLEKGFDMWIETISKQTPLTPEIILFDTRALNAISIEQFKKIIVGVEPPQKLIVSETESIAKAEKEPETNLKTEIAPVPLNSDLNGYKQFKGKVIVRRLGPNQPHQCFNYPYCVLEAVYEAHDPERKEPCFFCEADWVKTKRYYEDNGYRVEFSEEAS